MFPRISRNITSLQLAKTALEGEEDSSWIRERYWDDVPLSCMPPNFNPQDMEPLEMSTGRLKKLWRGVKSPENLVEIPVLSKAIYLDYLELNKSFVMLSSSIRNLDQLRSLDMEGCTMLEVLPVDIDFHLTELDLSGCSELRNFPRISTRIRLLYLDDTAIEEIPSWIKNMSSLAKLTMRRCKNLKSISAEIFKMICLEADFSDCGGITRICDHLPGPHNNFFDISSYPFGFPPTPPFKFYNCFSLDRDAHEIIIQSYPIMAVIPGGEVPTYFTHRACGSSLSILLSESSLSQRYTIVKACIVVGLSSHYPAGYFTVRQSFRGQQEETDCDFKADACTYEIDHMVFFNLHLPIKRVNNSPSELNNNVLLLEFYSNHYDIYYEGCSCGSPGRHNQNSTLEEIKGCGARVMDISETDYEESDEESDRSKEKMTVPTFQEHSNYLNIQPAVNPGLVAPNLDLYMGLAGASGGEESDEYYEGCSSGSSYGSHSQNSTPVEIKGCGPRVMNISKTNFRESDEESNRSKKKMRMTVPTFEDHSNSLYIQPAVNSEPTARNLELSLGSVGASGEVSSGSKVPSPSRNFCGDGASFLGGESLHFEPMIIEQQNTGNIQ
ncbi:hypothetical protein Rs2_27824 [Raphanus sativus]|nr:hypothetical protein Rs2_27824 [Raphanus sativus]